MPPGVAFKAESETAPLDLDAVARHLEAVGHTIDRGAPVRQFAGGLANRNYLVRFDGGWAVLRRPPDGPLPPKSHDMVREHRILSRLWRALPVAPRGLYLCEDREVIGVPFQILEFREGVAIRGDSVAPLAETVQTGEALSELLIDTLASIHAVDTRSVGLDDLGHPEGYFARTVAGWTKRAGLAFDGELTAAAREVCDWLAAVPAPGEQEAVLLHSDFKLDNILLDPETLRPNAVVDWDMGTRGPALADLTTTLSYWSEAGDPDCMRRLAQMPTAMPGFASREAAAHAYARRTGRSVDDIRPWRVLAMMRLGVIFLQLHRLHLTGSTQDPRYAGFRQLAVDLFDFTLDVARGRIF